VVRFLHLQGSSNQTNEIRDDYFLPYEGILAPVWRLEVPKVPLYLWGLTARHNTSESCSDLYDRRRAENHEVDKGSEGREVAEGVPFRDAVVGDEAYA
jgi:hypothetical protein